MAVEERMLDVVMEEQQMPNLWRHRTTAADERWVRAMKMKAFQRTMATVGG